MSELFIHCPYAYDHPTDPCNVPQSGVRAYRNSPETIKIQIRTTEARNRKKARYAGAELSLADTARLIEHLQLQLQEAAKLNPSDGL